MYKKSDKAELTVRDKMQLILDIGQLMMENGASSKRVVRDMLRAAAYLGIYWENVQIHITYSTIMINVDGGVTSETMFRKCYKHGVNMMTTLLANQLSWDALTSNESYLIYRNQMMTIQQMARKRLYPQWLTLFCIGMASSAFCLLFGGHWYEALYTFIAAVVGAYVKTLCERFGVNIYIGIAASAFFATATAYLTLYIPGPPCSWLPVVACALTLIPGVPLINCVDDFLSNYLNSGMTRFTQTILVMTAMTFGLSAIAVMTSVPNFTGVRIAPESLYIAQALAAAMAAAGFCVMFNIPKRYIPLACLGAIITVDMRNILMVDFGTGMATASFIGAATLSLFLLIVARNLHAPVFVLTTPAIIPLIPGVLLYRFLFAVIRIHTLTTDEFMLAMQNGVEAALVILGIALGATLPDVIAHQFIDRSKRERLRKILEERDGQEAVIEDAANLDHASERR